MTVIYHEEDGDLGLLSGKTVAVIGYGHMGQAMAHNLRDSGVQMIVADPRPERQAQIIDAGLVPATLDEATRSAEILLLLLRDELMPRIYLEQISPHLRRDQMLLFSNAYNVTFGFIEAPPFVDVGLVAARTYAAAVRSRYLSGEGFASFVAVAQDASRQAWQTVLAVARAIGALKGGAVEIGFEQETELDLFMQQAILPVFHQLIITAAQLLMARGYPPEAVFTELYLSNETSDYLRQAGKNGLMEALKLQSLTSQYGVLSRYERFADLKLERLMEITMEEIRSGRFAEEWAKEYAADYPRLQALRKLREGLDMWELEQQTLELLHRDDAPDGNAGSDDT
ncbi:MAG: NAD(P)-binding domain-containing protein [Chloroflexi bacterium]|nr:NAD(P)-binding domain-containing protein [Chloroflexota bacterium]